MQPNSNAQWSEENSQTFIDLGRYFVPNRAQQIATICALVPPRDEPFNVVELCCGEGVLAKAILQRFPASTVYGYDLSPAMLGQARQRLAAFGARFRVRQFDLADTAWRAPEFAVHAVVSSLAVHHLDDAGKAMLYTDTYAMLAPGGALVIADLIQPASILGERLAEREWDRAVAQRAQQLDGNADAVALFEQEQWNLYRYPDPLIDTPSRLFDQLKWLEQAGFSEVDVYWLRAGHAIYGGRKPSAE